MTKEEKPSMLRLSKQRINNTEDICRYKEDAGELWLGVGGVFCLFFKLWDFQVTPLSEKQKNRWDAEEFILKKGFLFGRHKQRKITQGEKKNAEDK